jgi:ferritin-like metal-binding protein YciE
MPPMTEPKDLLKHELSDLLYAERRFVTATRTLAQETNDPAMKKRIERHVAETEEHVERVKRAFEAIGEKSRGQKCEGAIGLREEHASFKSEEKPSQPLLEAFDLGTGLRVEHYEIAAYRTSIAMARALGYDECADILQENLDEEEEMAAFLTKMAPKALDQLFNGAGVGG